MTSTQNGGILEKKEIGLSVSTSGTHFNTEIDLLTNTLRLKKIGIDELGNITYEKEGYWISNIIDLQDKFNDFEKVFTSNINSGSSSISIHTRVSDDSLIWTDWITVSMDGTIQSETKRYIQIKINLFAGYNESVFLISNFKNSNDVNLFSNNEFIDTSNGLKLKRTYRQDMIKDLSWSESGSVFRKKIILDDWTRIDKLDTKKN